MKHRLELLEKRLAAWENERETNHYGLAHLAERAIVLVEREMAAVSSNGVDE